MMPRKRSQELRKSTGGKAPRKQISHPKLREWEQRHHPEFFGMAHGETQTFPSTSDQQVQVEKEKSTEGTQTNRAESCTQLQHKLEKVRESLKYVEDEKTLLWQRLHDSERLNKALINERTSLCTKDCCKDNV